MPIARTGKWNGLLTPEYSILQHDYTGTVLTLPGMATAGSILQLCQSVTTGLQQV